MHLVENITLTLEIRIINQLSIKILEYSIPVYSALKQLLLTWIKDLRFSSLENLENSNNSLFRVVRLLGFPVSCEASKLSWLEKFKH